MRVYETQYRNYEGKENFTGVKNHLASHTLINAHKLV